MRLTKIPVIILALIFFISFNLTAFGDTYSVNFRDEGCPDAMFPGIMPPYGYNDCTFGGSSYFSLGTPCPPGDQSGFPCNSTNWVSNPGTDNTLRVSFVVTFSTNKQEYAPNESIIPILQTSDITVTCPMKGTKILQATAADNFVLNLFDLSTFDSFASLTGAPTQNFTSTNTVSSFSLPYPGNYSFNSTVRKVPQSYHNDCNGSTDLAIQSGIATSFKIASTTPILLKLK